jgi:S-phase kinase-associated protein 1
MVRSSNIVSYVLWHNSYCSLFSYSGSSVKLLMLMLNFFLLEEGDEDTQEIPLPNVKASVLQKVIDFCTHHREDPMNDIQKPLKSSIMNEVVQQWYADFVSVEQPMLFELILAANYMDIKPLLDLTCAAVASMIKGKTPQEIRETFNIANDFSPEEEAQVREENRWCEEA